MLKFPMEQVTGLWEFHAAKILLFCELRKFFNRKMKKK